MPDKRRHRGPHPEDPEHFAAARHPDLRRAVSDLSWLLTHGYAPVASLKLVGDHLRLHERQRLAVLRSACSEPARRARAERRLAGTELAGRALQIDGFNVLTTVEAALSGGVMLIGRDGCVRDLAGVHGSYRRVEESLPALHLVGQCLTAQQAGPCLWLFDQPVSNSGRLAQTVEAAAREHGWPWRCQLCPDPDARLRRSEDVVVSADSAVLDACGPWFDLAAHVVQHAVPQAWVLDLR